jgi:L,D-transpeptidase YbiS
VSALKIIIDTSAQSLRVTKEGVSIFEAPVSTSRFGLGFEPGSFKTPTGLFRIAEKIGEESPIGTVFKGRQPFNEPIDWFADPDLITSRILWLDGSDPENGNTKDRYIYIHGTNQEELIGHPVSHGCVRMRNADIIDLFTLVDIETLVEILG